MHVLPEFYLIFLPDDTATISYFLFCAKSKLTTSVLKQVSKFEVTFWLVRVQACKPWVVQYFVNRQPFLWITLQHCKNEWLSTRGHILPSLPTLHLNLREANLFLEFLLVYGEIEGALTTQELVEHYSQRPHINFESIGLLHDDLRSHVSQWTTKLVGRLLRVVDARDAKIIQSYFKDAKVPILAKQEILTLDVPVDYVSLVHVIDCQYHLVKYFSQKLLRNRSIDLLEQRVQITVHHFCHDYEILVIFEARVALRQITVLEHLHYFFLKTGRFQGATRYALFLEYFDCYLHISDAVVSTFHDGLGSFSNNSI